LSREARSTIEILGSKVDRVTTESALARIEGWIADPAERPRFGVVTGFHGIWVGHQDPSFRAILDQADLFCPDGIAPVWLARLRGEPLHGRVPGAELMAAFLARANERGYGSFFYGDTDETLAALGLRLAERYPGHRVVGTFSPPFRPLSRAEDEEIVGRINQARPDILWVGLGLPKQERWIHAHLDRLEVPVAIGVGAAFGFLSGKVSRVPQWIGDAGFEWVWRFLAEPKKLWRRDLIDGPRFIYHGVRESLAYRWSRDRRVSGKAGQDL
jgi:N-acetylglucosaminyldiphosphoundecaprenol N-acetyl-beta-D-mannosaminyltransferase